MIIDGIEIFVKRLEGKGKLSFVLLHNAGGDHQFFVHQIDVLKNYGDVILVDLPGHGKSESLSGYAMSDLSCLIVQICSRLALKNSCLIGLNNGANIAIDVAVNHSLPLHSMVLIDPPLFMDSTFIHEIEEFIQQLDGEKYGAFVQTLVDALFIKTDSRNQHIATAAFNKTDKKSLQAMFKGLIEWDANSEHVFKKIACPTLCIVTDEHHCSYAKLKDKAPHVEIGKVIGSKCWATLEVPGQVNAMLERFLQING